MAQPARTRETDPENMSRCRSPAVGTLPRRMAPLAALICSGIMPISSKNQIANPISIMCSRWLQCDLSKPPGSEAKCPPLRPDLAQIGKEVQQKTVAAAPR
jgi:hypothetical protein